jgi:predicted alternative tryptophan synthase beta-subunit
MTEIFRRLYNITRSRIPKITRDKDHEYSSFEEFDPLDKNSEQDAGSRAGTSGQYQNVPQQVVEDLKVFDLTPPSSLEEVKKRRNEEIKKYHSDRFINDPERFKTSTEIMQIYNAAYERLKEYYNK